MEIRFIKWSATLLIGALAATSLSQSGSGSTIEPYRQLNTGPGVAFNTGDFSPQIKERFEFTARPLSPNSTPKVIPAGVANNLKPGGVTTKKNAQLRAQFPGIGFTGFVPPDPDLAVGPNHVVAVVNSDVAFFNKATGLKTFQQPGDGTGFFSGIGVTSDFTFDPKCYFDKLSQRFYVLFLELGDADSKFLLAVSDDADPNGTWHKYRIEAKVTEGSNTWWLDYPGFGMNKDALVLTGNMFPLGGSASGVFTSVAVIPKAPLLTGGNATASYFKDTSLFTLQMARTADASQAIVYGVAASSTSTLTMVAMTNLLGTPSMIKTNVTVPTYILPSDVPSGNGRQLDGLDGRLYNAHFRGGRLVTAHTTKANDGRMKARWYELAVNNWPTSGTPALRQSGDVLLAGTNTHMPAINTNAAGDISLIYSRNNGSTNPDTCISVRFAADPLGTMGAPQVIATSAGAYGGAGFNRWGDYFGMEIDPVDNLTFWGIGMVGITGGNWTTHINKWSVSSGAGAVLVDPTGASLIQGVLMAGDFNAIKTSDNSRYSIRSILIDKTGQETTSGVEATGQVASVQTDFDLDMTQGNLTDLKVVVEANVNPTGATGQVFAWDWSTGTFKAVGNFSMNTSDKVSTVSVQRSVMAKYVDGTGNVRIMVRAFSPVRGGRPSRIPPQFIFNVDRVALSPGFQTP